MKPIKNETRMSNDARIAVLETTILNINTTLLDIKQDMKRGFEKIDNKFDAFESKFDNKLDALDRKFDNKLDALENKFDSKFDTMDQKFEALETKMDNKFDAVQNRLWSNFLWLMGMIIGLAGLIAHTQDWV